MSIQQDLSDHNEEKASKPVKGSIEDLWKRLGVTDRTHEMIGKASVWMLQSTAKPYKEKK